MSEKQEKPVCAPLCGASKAYGRFDKPWHHEKECPVRIAWEQERKEQSPASMYAPCQRCGKSSEGVLRETVVQGEVERPGFKCECGWWNWLDSPPSNQESKP